MRVHRWLVVALLLAATLLTSPLASAQGPDGVDCGSSIWQQSNTPKLDTAALMAEAKKLESFGATVYIRTYAGDTALQPKLRQFIESCPSWRDQGGRLKANLLVFMISGSDLLFQRGDAWDTQITQQESDGISQSMDNSDDTVAIVTGEKAAVDQLDGVNWDDTWVLSLLIGVPFLVIVLALSALGRRRRKARQLAEAQAAAQQARNAAVELVGQLEAPLPVGTSMSNLAFNVSSLMPQLSAADRDRLQAEVDKGQQLYADTVDRQGKLSDEPDYNPDYVDELSQCATVTANWQELHQQAMTAQQQLLDIKLKCDDLGDKLEDAPEHMAELQEELSSQERLYQETSREIPTDVASSMQTARGHLTEAKRQIDAGHPGEALDDLDKAEKLLEQLPSEAVEPEATEAEEPARSDAPAPVTPQYDTAQPALQDVVYSQSPSYAPPARRSRWGSRYGDQRRSAGYSWGIPRRRQPDVIIINESPSQQPTRRERRAERQQRAAAPRPAAQPKRAQPTRVQRSASAGKRIVQRAAASAGKRTARRAQASSARRSQPRSHASSGRRTHRRK